MTITRKASCRCGQLTVICKGEPVRVSVCHCSNCQKRSGSAFAVQARFAPENVVIAGEERVWEAVSDSGNTATFHFCPHCGSDAYYKAKPFSDLIAVPVGAFADNAFPGPIYSVYEGRMHKWVEILGNGVEHYE